MLNAELVFGFVFVGCLWLFSLWENPPAWRTLRQTEGGIFHRQAAALWVRVVLAAAWWHENVASASCVPVCDFLNLLLKKIRYHGSQLGVLHQARAEQCQTRYAGPFDAPRYQLDFPERQLCCGQYANDGTRAGAGDDLKLEPFLGKSFQYAHMRDVVQ